MNDDELRRAYRARTPAGRDSARPTPDELRRVAIQEGPEGERLEILERALAHPEARRQLELLRAIGSAGAAEERRPRRVLTLPLALAASVVLVAAAALLLRPDRDQEAVRAPEVAGSALPVTPGMDATVPAGPVAFAWRAVPGATGYRLEVLSEAGGVASADETRDTVMTVTLPAPGTAPVSYRWSVIALLPDGVEVPSRPRRITLTP